MDVTERLVDHIVRAVDAPLPEQALLATRHHVLDTIAAVVSGSVLPAGRAGRAFADARPAGRCVVVCRTSGADPADAAMANAMAAHADDLRQASRSRVEARARAVGVRAALPLGVCLLPAFVLLGVVPLVAGSLSVVTLP